ncbi:MAG: hypothetical protein IPP85_14220 [Propionivibrio sp.]|nr:hypothetical protein [Propionivibrio sp.]
MDSALQHQPPSMGVDGISMLFVILNSFITVIVVLAGWKVINKQGGPVQRRFSDHVGAVERDLRIT